MRSLIVLAFVVATSALPQLASRGDPRRTRLARRSADNGPLLAHASLAGRSNEEVAAFARALKARGELVGAQPLPAPASDTSAKLVNDDTHPWMPLEATDIRGPCPGLNTLASHGYLPRNGVASPGDIINAVQEGFNMGFDLAAFVTYATFLVDGNHLSNLLSIGQKTDATGPASDTTVGGLNTHGVFEGDASMTRGDFFFGDNHSFNETLFDQLVDFSNEFGNGTYNFAAAAQLRFTRLQQSQATNPTFDFGMPRFATAYAEATFPFAMFTSDATALDLTSARGFFQNSSMPVGFVRREGPYGGAQLNPLISKLQAAHPFPPGRNEGLGNYIPVTIEQCTLYEFFAQDAILQLYPNPEGYLLAALKENLHTFFTVSGVFGSCPEVFPYGQ